MARRHASLPWLTALAVAAALLSGCDYTLRGKAVQGSYSAIMFVPADDPRLDGKGIPGVNFSVTRDPGELSAKTVGTGVSGPNGEIGFPLAAVGAGITDEEWLVRGSRSGYSNVESQVRIPINASAYRLLVIMAPGRAAPNTGFDMSQFQTDSLSESERIMQEYEQYR